MSKLFGNSQNTNQNQNTSQTQNGNFNTNSTGTTAGTTAGTSTSSTAGTAPDWVTAAIKAATNATGGLAGANPQSFVAGATPNLQQAGTTALGLSGTPWDTNRAIDETNTVINSAAPHMAAATASPFIGSYLDPYQNDVINSTMKDFDQQAGQTRAQDDLALAGSGAFGGSGAALTKSQTEGQLSRARASTLSGLESQNYGQALTAAQQDAQRKQDASATNAQLYGQQLDRQLAGSRQVADLGSNYEAQQRANIGAQSGVGSILQDIAQKQAGAPLALAQFGTQNLSDLLRGFFGGTSTGSTTGSTTGTSTGNTSGTTASSMFGNSSSSGTTTNNPSAMSDIGDLIAIASMFASDRRLKRDIRRVGELANGLGLYAYRYVWSPLQQFGVMAQEVLKVKPEAVAAGPDGFLMVDYGRL